MIGLIHGLVHAWPSAYMIAWGYLAIECRNVVR